MTTGSITQMDNSSAIDETIGYLKKRSMIGWKAADAAHARKIIKGIVPDGAVVGIGDSSSVRQIGVIPELEAQGNRVLNGFNPSHEIKDVQTHFSHGFWPMLRSTVCDVFLTGSNAITRDGKIVNVDGNGNRVAGMVWGHPICILVIGRNKIVQNLDQALDRVKNVISPEHLRRKGAPSPCTRTGYCHDCLGETKVCAVTTIIERKPAHTQIHVVIVDDDLGLGWDPAWPLERIERIVRQHESHMAMCPLPLCILDPGNNDKLWQMAREQSGDAIWPGSKSKADINNDPDR
jgi:hypothetical protein